MCEMALDISDNCSPSDWLLISESVKVIEAKYKINK